jgi:hypothetical protein
LRSVVALLFAALAVALLPASARAESSTCSKGTAQSVAARLHWGDPTLGKYRVGDVVCGPFFGPGSKGMAATAALPSCGGSYEWAVFRYRGGSWRRVLLQRHGAFLSKSGSADIVEKQGSLQPGDAHCFPSRYKSRVWHWDGKRFTKTRWRIIPDQFLSPDRKTWCQFSSIAGEAKAWCGSRTGDDPGRAEHSAGLKLDGSLELCNHPPDGFVCMQNWNDAAPVLAVGSQAELYGFRCTSEPQGIHCVVIATGKGFVINADGVAAA